MAQPSRWLFPAWTASQADLQWPQTYLLTLFVVISPLPIWTLADYSATNEPVPTLPLILISFIYGIVVPELALRESTEVLFDGTRLSLQIATLTFCLMTVLSWTVYDGGFPVNSWESTALFILATCGLYATVVFGFVWMIQFARKGTSGVEY